jgi:hypothetical protein
MNALITLYIIRDNAGQPIGGPYAVESTARFRAAIIHTDRPPAYVTAHDFAAFIPLDPSQS